MSTSLQLVPAYFDSKPEQWRRDYVKNMRQIRGYPTYWRIRDDIENVDGPPEGERYTRELFIWEARILKDSEGYNTNKIALYNLIESTNTQQLPNGVSVYKPQEPEPVFVHEHTDIVDSVSVEFDQSGRRMLAWESGGHIWMMWYDAEAEATVVTDFGPGRTPQVVTDKHVRTRGSGDSTRYLFFVDASTSQIVYLRQLDRFGELYTLPDAPTDVVELLKVSKNLYGGLTVLYCYESAGELQTGSFTARSAPSTVHIGTDHVYRSSRKVFTPIRGEGLVSIRPARVSLGVNDAAQLKPRGVSVSVDIVSRKKIHEFADTPTLQTTGHTARLEIASVVYNAPFSDATTLSTTDTAVSTAIRKAAIRDSLDDSANMQVQTTSVLLTLG